MCYLFRTLARLPYQTIQVNTIIAILASIGLRLSLLDYESHDFRDFLSPWYDFIRQNEGLWALKDDFSNYSPPYLYFLVAVVTTLGYLPKVVAIKLITFPFEGLCSVLIYKILNRRYKNGPLPRLAALTFLFAPTVVLNGSYWGQSDIIYTTGLVGCLYFLCLGQANWALVNLGMAIAVKQQALWFLPVIFILLVKKQLNWRVLIWIPLVYIVAIIPAWIAGRPLGQLLSIYVNQANTYQKLTLNAPTIYQWIPDQWYGVAAPLGILFTCFIVIGFIGIIIRQKNIITPELLIQLSLISLVIIPYFSPKMHDRYFFAADIFSLIYGFYFADYFWIALAINAISLFSYFPFLTGHTLIPLPVLSFLLGCIILGLCYHLKLSLINLKTSSV